MAMAGLFPEATGQITSQAAAAIVEFVGCVQNGANRRPNKSLPVFRGYRLHDLSWEVEASIDGRLNTDQQI